MIELTKRKMFSKLGTSSTSYAVVTVNCYKRNIRHFERRILTSPLMRHKKPKTGKFNPAELSKKYLKFL